MPIAIRMPALFEDMQEGKVVTWPYALGTEVARGAVIVVIEADKSEVEIEASVAGFVRHYYVRPGDVVRCGTLLGVLTASKEEPFDPVVFEVDEMTP